jgi:polyphenol oxidase
MILAKTLADLDGVQHRFFTRQGGVSSGLYSSLNCGYGSGDQPENVRENRRRVADHFGLDEPDLQTLHQVHSTDVLTVGEDRW